MDREGLAGRAPIVDEKTFLLITELEIRKAVRLEYFVSLLGVECDLDVARLGLTVSGMNERLARIISNDIRGTDTIGLITPSSCLFVLFVGTNLSNMLAILERFRRFMTRHAPEIQDQRGDITLAIGASCFPSTARNRVELFSQVEGLVADARADRSRSFRYRIASIAS